MWRLLFGVNRRGLWGNGILNCRLLRGEDGRDLGEVAEPLFEIEAGSSSSSETVLARGVAIWLGGLVLPARI